MAKSANLGEQIQFAPPVFDPDAAQRLSSLFGATFTSLTSREQSLIEGVAGCSPYLRRLMGQNIDMVVRLLRTPPDESLSRVCASAQQAAVETDQAAQMRVLRHAKTEAALVIALADIAKVWDVMTAAHAVSQFADAAVEAALRAAMVSAGLERDAHGICVLAMGKQGGEELNYSSDIDLIVLFDAERIEGKDRTQAQAAAVKTARQMVNLLQMQTADGYVFRTDLRLRPDPGVSALAISVQAAEAYYEAYGQNWERMAFIKARVCAGDLALGNDFLTALRPFIWRKFLDFAAIADVQAVKRQIQSAKGGATIEFEGHDIKLGRGGIREVEFYAQTQQLILGGKDRSLRSRQTITALKALNDKKQIDDGVCDELVSGYQYLRHIEHRLQMINDEQTHKIPNSVRDIERLALFAGEENAEALGERLSTVLHKIQHHYDDLFRSDIDDTDAPGPLVFTGVEDDPATIETLKSLGFQRPGEISEKIRRWHAGGMRATKTERARLILTQLMAPLLEALSRASNPDDAFFSFSNFLSRLPSGVQVFSLLANNVDLFDTLIRIMTISPFLGRELSRRINFIEQLVENSLTAPPPDLSAYEPQLHEALQQTEDYEGALNVVRRWAGERKFLITAQLAVGVLETDKAAAHFSTIAHVCINALAPLAHKDMRRLHGDIDGSLIVAGLGRLGANEMTATSDIDLIFIYEASNGCVSTGPRALGASEYFTRLVRRIITSLSAATPEGALYDVDMQLRPSGRSGPAAVSVSAFERYYSEDAWTWEMMAMTRAKVIFGPPALAEKVESAIAAMLSRERSPEAVVQDVHDMRLRLLKAKKSSSPWDVKNVVGGLTDIAFIAQYLSLIAAHNYGRPPSSTAMLLEWLLDNGVIGKSDVEVLETAQRLFENVLHTGRAATGSIFEPNGAGKASSERMAIACGVEDIEQAENLLTQHQKKVAHIYQTMIGPLPHTAADVS